MVIDTRSIVSPDSSNKQEEFLNYLLKIKNSFNVTRSSFIDGFSEIDIPVAIAYRPNSKVLSQSGGKGISRSQAMISALMESFECDAAEKIIPCIEKKNINEIKKLNKNFIHPKYLPTTLTQFEDDLPIDWSYCRNLFTNKIYLVPFDAISLDFTRMCNINEPAVMQLSSNGLASGMTENEAILSAIYEIIERHSSASCYFKPNTNNRIVDLNSIKNQDLKNCICKFINKKFNLIIRDLTIFDEFPTYSSYLYDQYGNGYIGWGCSSNSEIAFLRALIESNQARTTQISGAREDMYKFDYLLRKKITDIDHKKNIKNKAIDFENEKKDINIKDYKELKSIFRKYDIPDPLCFTFENNLDMFAVRVVIPKLHGYLYPGYEAMIRKEFFEELTDYQSKTRHYPAAI